MEKEKENKELPDYVQRMVEEYKQLDDRSRKLNRFLAGEKFGELDTDEQYDLEMQAQVMAMYQNILLHRLMHKGVKLLDLIVGED